MHLPDGLVPVELALAGYAGSGALAAMALSRIKRLPDPSAAIPRAAMLTTVFFAASLVAVPVPPASVHLMLAGLLGVMLGWFAVPAILVGLFLQAVLFGHGGLTTLGLNGLILGLPALLAFGIWRAAGRRWPDMAALCAGSGAVVAALAIFAGFVLLGLPVALDASAERVALQLFVLAHVPLVMAEGVIVLVLLRVLRRTAPQMLAHA
ncbi:cobalt transporter CbiM [Roseinatronobacter monicus]|uniref:cobalt transporter CbiM n=1 Tax=Roseinatronobacter monicus TaxID=393481 RepID=UPI003F40EF9D